LSVFEEIRRGGAGPRYTRVNRNRKQIVEKSPAETPSLYDLYGPTSLLNLERTIAEGKIPTASELAAILEANSEKPLPAWFIATVVKSLRGELKKRSGRPKASPLSEIRFAIAKARYPLYLAWLRKRQSSSGLDGWSAVRGKDWWAGPPHERAARIVTKQWLKHMSWRAFLNRISS
jgi:hypothetical protein